MFEGVNDPLPKVPPNLKIRKIQGPKITKINIENKS
jgi:hypothetical protein